MLSRRDGIARTPRRRSPAFERRHDAEGDAFQQPGGDEDRGHRKLLGYFPVQNSVFGGRSGAHRRSRRGRAGGSAATPLGAFRSCI